MKNHGSKTFLSGLSKGLLFAPLLCLMPGCQDSEFDKYYERPGWLESPAMSLLEQRNDCKIYLQLAQRTLFSKQLEGSGSYTFFVPTDAAFEAFFADNAYGYKSAADIPDDVVSDFISYTMLYNQYPCDSLGNTLDAYNTWSSGAAYKHQTPAYDVLSRDYVDGDSIWVYDYTGSWYNAWHNYRYLPVLSNNYFKENALQTSDYTWFFPNSTRSEYGNMLGAQILNVNYQNSKTPTGDLYCENGVIHLVDKVVMPLLNLDKMICTYGSQEDADLPATAQGGAWKELKQFIYHKKGDGSYQFLNYTTDATALHYFEKMYPDLNLENLQLRAYSTTANKFPLNLENYYGGVEGDDAFNSGYTIFLPTTSVLDNYVSNRLLSYVSDKSDWDVAFNELSEDVLPVLLQSIFSNGIVWRSQYGNAQNIVGSNEFVNGGVSGNTFGESTVKSSAFASNGLYHVVNFMPKTAAFEGVGSRVLLDPAYSFMNQLYTRNYATSIYSHMLYSKLSNYNAVSLSLILTSDAQLTAFNGMNYDAVDARFENAEGTDQNSYINSLATHSYIERDTTDKVDFEVDPLNGAYGGWGFANTYSGEVIRYKKTGNTVAGKPEIMVQSYYNIMSDPTENYNLAAAVPTTMPQTVDPTTGNYVAVTKDPTYDEYLNGNVYVATESTTPLYYGDYSDISGMLDWYLRCDSAQAVPQHSIFKAYWDLAKTSGTKPSFGSGLYTILVPTDAALQHAIGKGYMLSPDDMAKDQSDAVWADTCAQFCNIYLLANDCYPDDGASSVYGANTWSCPNAPIDLSSGLLVGTSCKPMTEEWEDLMSGTTKMSMRLSKVEATHKLRFLGKSYDSGIYTAVQAYNASDDPDAGFTNTVIRELGQSNVLASRSVIHSFDGYVVYKIQQNPSKHPSGVARK